MSADSHTKFTHHTKKKFHIIIEKSHLNESEKRELEISYDIIGEGIAE